MGPFAARPLSGAKIEKSPIALLKRQIRHRRPHSSNLLERPIDASDTVSVAKRRYFPRLK